jgi:hypothetical protein
MQREISTYCPAEDYKTINKMKKILEKQLESN